MQNKKKHKTLIALLVALALCFSTVTTSFALTEAEEKQQEAEEAEAKADEAQEKKEAAEESMEEMTKRYNELQTQIESTQAEIETTKADIEAKEEEIESQVGALDDRLEVMYKTGTVGIIDVILSSQSITELVSNIGMVQKVLKNDQDILAKLKQDLKELGELRETLETQEASLQASQDEAEELREKYKKQAEKYEKEEEELRQEAEELAAEAERLKQAGEGKYTPTDFGQYMWPTASNWYYTSYYGWRIHPILGYKKYHSGYDIVLTEGTNGAPLYAVGNGYVTKASWYGGYGNCVMINIGNGYTVLYGHLSGYNVTEGQTVTKGDVIGYIGSTGLSTGPHLHFSLYKDGELTDPLVLYQ